MQVQDNTRYRKDCRRYKRSPGAAEISFSFTPSHIYLSYHTLTEETRHASKLRIPSTKHVQPLMDGQMTWFPAFDIEAKRSPSSNPWMILRRFNLNRNPSSTAGFASSKEDTLEPNEIRHLPIPQNPFSVFPNEGFCPI